MNQDVQTRDKLIFGEYNPDAYLGGVRYFENLSLDTLNTLLENKFIAAGERQNDAPTTAQIKSFMARYPEYTAHGYAVAINRRDYRVTLEGVSKGRGADSAQELADFTECSNSLIELNTATMDC